MGLVDKVSLDVGFCFYETSLETVKRAIESVKDNVRYIYAIDGKYELYESNELLSSPDIRDYLSSIDNVVMVDYPNRKENEKRQRYLDLCNKDLTDWLLILDADEFITDETDWDLVYRQLTKLTNESRLPSIYGVTIKPYSNSKKEFGYPRLWRAPYLIDYMETHNFWKFRTDGRVFRSSTDWERIEGIFMRGNDKLRDDEYNKKSYAYQLKLMKYESPYKMKYREIAENTKVWNQKDTRMDGLGGVPVM